MGPEVVVAFKAHRPCLLPAASPGTPLAYPAFLSFRFPVPRLWATVTHESGTLVPINRATGWAKQGPVEANGQQSWPHSARAVRSPAGERTMKYGSLLSLPFCCLVQTEGGFSEVTSKGPVVPFTWKCDVCTEVASCIEMVTSSLCCTL